ncbi:MAG: hypothetical protein AB7U34_07485 [Novosphingobium sp.]
MRWVTLENKWMSQGHAHSLLLTLRLLLTLPVVRVSLSKLTSAQVQRVHLFGDEKWVLLQGTSKNPIHGIFRGRSSRETRNELTLYQSLTRLRGSTSMCCSGTSKGFSRCPSLTINKICNFGMRQHSKMGKPQRWYRNDDWLYQLDDVH